MKKIIFLVILFISLSILTYGIVNKNKKIREVGYAGLIFLIIAAISEFIYYLDF